MNIEAELFGVKQDTLLKDYTTFKIGGAAKYFFVAKTKDDLVKAVEFAKKNKIAFFILGGGSNLLISDKGFNGLMIKIQNSKIKIQNYFEIYAEAGASGFDVAKFAAENLLSGLEWAVGIPGMTIGGAIFGNAQAFGTKTSDLIKTVEAFDIKTLKFIKLTNKQCQFTLKNSIFKKNKNLIIVSAVLKLKKASKEEIEEKTKRFLEHRKKGHPMDFPSAGSFFVNPEIKIKDKRLLLRFPELNVFNEKGFIPSAYLIEKAGLKGKQIGGAKISEKHANFIINFNNAKANDILKLANLAQKKVEKTFGIKLEMEVQRIGF